MIFPRRGFAEQEYPAAGLDLGAGFVGREHGGARGQPGGVVAVQFAQEGSAHQVAGGEEAGVFLVLGPPRGGGAVGGCRLEGVGGRGGDGEVVVEVADEGGEGDAGVVEAFREGGGVVGGVDGDAVVVGVDGLDELVVELAPEDVRVSMVRAEAGALGDDGFAEVKVHEAGGGELGVAPEEGGVEGALVVVVAVLGRVVLTADVDDGVACGEEGGVAGAEEGAGGVGGEEAEEVDGQGFVGVEVAVVGADKGRGGFDAFGGR